MIKFLTKYCLLIIISIELMCSINTKWGGERWKQILGYDGKGYYAYLPAIFIYHDMQFSYYEEIEKKYSSKHNYYDYRVQRANGTVDKYFAGTALAVLPFFAVAHLVTIMTGGITDGYSFFYQIAICIAAIFYCYIGLYYQRKILISFSFTDKITTAALLSIGLGTHLFYYATYDPSMSHIYSFAFISIFIYYARKIFQPEGQQYLPLLGILTGIIILIRPVNGLIIFIIPFLAGSPKAMHDLLSGIFKKLSLLIFTLLIAMFIISIQGWLYYLQCGEFFIYSYTNEYFIWSRPEIINILFSYRKGLFIYTPITFISLAGFIHLYKKNRFAFFSLFIFLFLITYIFSCWVSWWYGGSFSSRPFVEYMSVFGILLAYLISGVTKKLYRVVTYVILVSCIIISHIQFYQFRYFIIHWEKMDKEHYWRIFLRVDQLARQENVNKDLL